MVFMVARIGERAAVSGARKASRRPRSPDPRGEGNGTGVKAQHAACAGQRPASGRARRGPTGPQPGGLV